MSDMMTQDEALRRVVWREVLNNAAVEFCELRRAPPVCIVAGKIIADASSTPGYVSYELVCSEDLTRCDRVRLERRTDGEAQCLSLVRISEARWLKNGARAPELDGCSDPDLEWSPSTNVFPIRRLARAHGAVIELRAAWVRLPGLAVEPSLQTYTRLDARRVRYRNEQSGFEARVEVDELGLPINYEHIWTRTADWRAP